LLDGEVAMAFLEQVVDQARRRGLLSGAHFTVDGTLLEAWAGLKDEPAPPSDDPGNPTVDFHGERRSNATHASTTDPEARLARKGRGREAKLSYAGHAAIDNRHGLVINAQATPATGTAEREAAVEMATALPAGTTLGADKGYDTRGFVEVLRSLGVTPHVAQNITNRSSAIDGRTTRHAGYRVSQQKRKLIEEILRLAQDGRADAQAPASWGPPGRLALHLCGRGLQPRAHPQSHMSTGLSARRGQGWTPTGPRRTTTIAVRRRGDGLSSDPRYLFTPMEFFIHPGFSAAC
jgi:hypothetical protein